MTKKLHKNAIAFKKAILAEYDLTPDEQKILDGAVDQLSVYWMASDLLASEGLTFRAGDQIRQHPAVQIAKQSWAGFLAGCRLLQIGKPDPGGRPGRPCGVPL